MLEKFLGLKSREKQKQPADPRMTRRNFLKTATVASAILTMPGLAFGKIPEGIDIYETVKIFALVLEKYCEDDEERSKVLNGIFESGKEIDQDFFAQIIKYPKYFTLLKQKNQIKLYQIAFELNERCLHSYSTPGSPDDLEGMSFLLNVFSIFPDLKDKQIWYAKKRILEPEWEEKTDSNWEIVKAARLLIGHGIEINELDDEQVATSARVYENLNPKIRKISTIATKKEYLNKAKELKLPIGRFFSILIATMQQSDETNQDKVFNKIVVHGEKIKNEPLMRGEYYVYIGHQTSDPTNSLYEKFDAFNPEPRLHIAKLLGLKIEKKYIRRLGSYDPTFIKSLTFPKESSCTIDIGGHGNPNEIYFSSTAKLPIPSLLNKLQQTNVTEIFFTSCHSSTNGNILLDGLRNSPRIISSSNEDSPCLTRIFDPWHFFSFHVAPSLPKNKDGSRTITLEDFWKHVEGRLMTIVNDDEELPSISDPAIMEKDPSNPRKVFIIGGSPNHKETRLAA